MSNVLFEQYGTATVEAKGIKTDDILKMKSQYSYNDKPRASEIYMKKLDDGGFFISVQNGKFPDGKSRQTGIVLTAQQKEELKEFLK